MRRLAVAILAVAVAAGCSSSSHHRSAPVPERTSVTTAAPPARPARVLLVVLENREYGEVAGKSLYLTELTARFGSATHAYGTTHPSLPNYLELVAGQTFGITSDCTDCRVEGTTLVDQLRDAGVQWTALMENAPGACFTGPSAPGGYAKKHNPFAYFSHLVADRSMCSRVVPLGSSLVTQLPDASRSFTWVTPNLCHDGHDCSTQQADTWLRQQVEPVLTSPWFDKDAVVIITYDEGTTNAGCCNGQAHGGHIVTIVASPGTKPGSTVDTPLDQAGILGTVEDLFGLARLGDATCPCAGSLLSLVRPGA